MRTRARAVHFAILFLFASPAGAQVDLSPTPDWPAPNAPPSMTLPADKDAAPKPRAAPNPSAKTKGEPGMMGLPWPKSPDEAAKTLDSLYAFLATADEKRRGGDIGAAIEKLWRLEGGDTVNLLIDRGEAFSARMEQDKALKQLDAAVDLAPDYAEAWSHRAYVHYRMNNYEAALGDLRRALALEPNHFRALDGMAKILVLIGEKKGALKAYEQLLKVHPNIEGAAESAAELRKTVEGQGI